MIRASLLLLVLLLAGCGDAPMEAEVPAADEAVRVPAPTWSVGHWWTYEAGDGAATWVVTGDLGQDWQVETDDPGLAFAHLYQGQVSTLGAVSKTQLAGSQEAGRVDFFDFPLEDGKTWDMTWDGAAYIATASVRDDNMVHVTVTNDTLDPARSYVYDPDVGWFSEMAFHDTGLEVRLVDHGANHTGEVARWTLLEERTSSGLGHHGFHVPEEATDIWIHVLATCIGNGGYSVHAAPFEGGLTEPVTNTRTCPAEEDSVAVREPESRGDWRFETAARGMDAFEATLLVRQLEMVPTTNTE